MVCGEAADGQQAVQLASQLTPDIFILDCSMPMLNGLDATKEILKIAPQTPIVMFTLHKDPHIQREALRVGAMHMVSKADGVAALIAAIEDSLQRTGHKNGSGVASATVGPLAVPTDLPAPLVAPLPPAVDLPITAATDVLAAAVGAPASEASAAPVAPPTEPVVLPSNVAPPEIPPEPGIQ